MKKSPEVDSPGRGLQSASADLERLSRGIHSPVTATVFRFSIDTLLRGSGLPKCAAVKPRRPSRLIATMPSAPDSTRGCSPARRVDPQRDGNAALLRVPSCSDPAKAALR